MQSKRVICSLGYVLFAEIRLPLRSICDFFVVYKLNIIYYVMYISLYLILSVVC